MKIYQKILGWAAVIFTLIYIFWRIFFSLPFGMRFVDMFFGVLLLVSELLGFSEALNFLSGMGNVKEPEAKELDPEQFPEVDVFIATYDEPAALLEKTVNGCLNMDYPDKKKVHIYLCDDTRRDEIRDLAEKMGVGYFRRADNAGKKAGNLNHALAHTTSPYVVTLDADMIPMHDFLTTLIPYFYPNIVGKTSEDEKNPEKVGFVQCPQSFYNTDLFQYNLYSENSVPNEQDFFFKSIQLIRNKHNSAIYAGSNTIIAREALEACGGFYTESITEDLATGLKIQSAGYRGISISSVHASGLAPTDMTSLFKQRDRWARGCIQTCRRLHILTRKGMTPMQRLDYLNSLLYWYTPLRRMIFILAPILFSIFHVYLLDCSLQEIVLVWLPHYVFYNLALKKLSNDIRNSRLSNIYDTILFPHLIPGIVLETFGITKSKFAVTKKEKQQEETLKEKIKLSLPLLVFFVFDVWGLAACLFRTFWESTGAYLIILFWLISNLYDIVLALMFMFGRKSMRQSERFYAPVHLCITFGPKHYEFVADNISEGGLRFHTQYPMYLPNNKELQVKISDEMGRYHAEVSGKVLHVTGGDGRWNYSMQFTEIPESQKWQLYNIIYDRVPTLPMKISKASGFYTDLRNNIFGRRKKAEVSGRKQPRIVTHSVFYTSEGERIKFHNFNYECVLLSMEKESAPENLKIILGENAVMECRFMTEFAGERGTQKKYLYQICNCEELMGTQDFCLILLEWIEGAQRSDKMRSQLEKEIKKAMEHDEFDELSYL